MIDFNIIGNYFMSVKNKIRVNSEILNIFNIYYNNYNLSSVLY
ncbi:Conserved hypothetical protein [Clostridium neonatale]|uniref:Uncharacterized protein n=1 Tax=Clostridium neonatale TaxID=137838 RepID=A0AA86JGF7_9CLOT|nr:Conserved hypothetical protein [Clostridium neonatale]CAH0436946.1 Conserved hypothetical protein [Clostridium neonatale]CAI3195236.1 Conserved hypothetical protein [Clostridium neonatale]CAI3242685.1 Conserved hypothetical protein [Clostridium neonatale]CAI3561777.1 Conserved hypothetical protein [Clostridium neonatale]